MADGIAWGDKERPLPTDDLVNIGTCMYANV